MEDKNDINAFPGTEQNPSMYISWKYAFAPPREQTISLTCDKIVSSQINSLFFFKARRHTYAIVGSLIPYSPYSRENLSVGIKNV